MLNLPNVEPPAAAEGKKEDGPANNRNDQAAADNKPAQGDTASSDKKEEIPSDKKEEAAVGEAISQDQAADNKDRTTVETPDKQEVAPADEKEQDDKAEGEHQAVLCSLFSSLVQHCMDRAGATLFYQRRLRVVFCIVGRFWCCVWGPCSCLWAAKARTSMYMLHTR
jgi:hypothetical protein